MSTARRLDPFAPLAPLVASLKEGPLPPVLFVSGDDDWIVGEAARRLTAAFREARPDGEVSSYEAFGNGVREAIADAATVALFATHRLVVLDGTELFRTKKLTAEEVDALLDEAEEAGISREGGGERAALDRLARRARALVRAAGADPAEDPEDAARRVAGRVKRSDRAPELATLLARGVDEADGGEDATSRLVEYVEKAEAGDNALLVTAVHPDPEHRATALLRRQGRTADFVAPDEDARRDRLASLGLERALERRLAADPEVFDVLTARGRLAARPFLLELDKLMDAAPAGRVTAEAAERLVADERKEYGSDFVEAVAERRAVDALGILERLLAGGEFTAFRPFGKADAAGPRKGPRGDQAIFPLVGLLAGEVRRMLALKAAAADRAPEGRGLRDGPPRRVDYRTFQDRVLASLKAARPGAAPLALEGHPFALHKAWTSAGSWSLEELSGALRGLEALDRGVKTGAGSGRELLEGWVLTFARGRA